MNKLQIEMTNKTAERIEFNKELLQKIKKIRKKLYFFFYFKICYN